MYWQRRAVRSCPTVEGPLMVNAFVSLHKMLPNFSYQFRCPLCRVPKWNLMIAGGLAPRSRRFPFLRITWTNLQRFTNRWETHTTDEGNCYFEWLEQSVVLAGFIPRDTDILGANFPDTCPETRLGLAPAATPRDPMERDKRFGQWHDMTGNYSVYGLRCDFLCDLWKRRASWKWQIYYFVS